MFLRNPLSDTFKKAKERANMLEQPYRRLEKELNDIPVGTEAFHQKRREVFDAAEKWSLAERECKNVL